MKNEDESDFSLAHLKVAYTSNDYFNIKIETLKSWLKYQVCQYLSSSVSLTMHLKIVFMCVIVLRSFNILYSTRGLYFYEK